MDRPIRVRYAPSPTGPQHLGGIRTALYNYLFARKNNGTFIIRIEDTDQNRFVPGAEDYMLQSLSWCGITYDEGPGKGGSYGPYKQSERKHLYREYADKLIESGNAYYAFDTPAELEAMREKFKASGMAAAAYNAATREYMKNSLVLPADEVKAKIDAGENYVIRMKMPRKEEIKFNDLIRGWVSFQSNLLDDKVLFKSDGMPTYHLANVVDDYLMKITHVIRGEEWLPSAPLHVMLYKYLGWEDVMPSFCHLPLILRPDGNGKLSKRDGDRLGFPVFPLNWKDPETGELSIGFRERGFFPQPFVNMIALLGWHPGHIQQEVFTMDELINLFSIEHVGKSGARFNFEKAKWFNQEYIKNLDNKILADSFKKILSEKSAPIPSEERLEAICGALKDRCSFINELWEQGSFYFVPPEKYDEGIVANKWNATSKAFIEKFRDELPNIEVIYRGPNLAYDLLGDKPIHNTGKLEESIHNFIKSNNLSNGDVLPLLRTILTGLKVGPTVHDLISLMGKETSIERINLFINKFKI